LPWIIALSLKILAGLVLALLVYLWIPEKSPKKRKEAITRLNQTLEGVPGPPEGKKFHGCSPKDSCESLPAGTPHWQNGRIIRFYSEYVQPYAKVLANSGYLPRIIALLTLLDAQGNCPSVVQIAGEQGQNIYRLLSRITLLEHSINVAEKIVQEVLRQGVKDAEMLVGKLLVAALGHDIGKIPDLAAASTYSKGDHAYLSYLVMKNAILTQDFPQREEILKAVKEHHYKVETGLTGLLRKADHLAREGEAEMLAAEGESVTELVGAIRQQSEHNEAKGTVTSGKGEAPQLINLDWLDLNEFAHFVEPYINMENEGRFKAFSMNNGLVYLMLDLVSDTVVRLAQKHNHPEVLVNAQSREKKRAIEYTVKTMLMQEGHIPSFIGAGYSGARFALYNKEGKKLRVGIYMPVSVQFFKATLKELEARKNKTDFLKQIKEVQPKTGSKAEPKNR